ncbi:Hypothetical protein AT6N2_L1149 [Agrobacterium tumefaciens]|uniref:hypothetical protein n=1 Tax=Agrobacterium tumefaciens TaxID=358 RepID=UPI001ADCFB8E|nr:hypothetical protein [Agrobacterium tumefaciens]QTK81963.1 Hypothetical protein AT6N2_L1149 [Agrobacterium tumefaciens]
MHFTTSLVAQLETAANADVKAVLQGRSGPPPAGEVATLADLVLNGTPTIAANWQSILAPQHSVTFHAVFCHGSPYVDFTHGGASRACELADLLLVMDYFDSTGSTRQAALVQAKLVLGGQIAISGPGPTTQLVLYQNWPSFTFQSAAYSQHSRNFWTALSAAADAGRYGGIDLTLQAEEWRQIDPSTQPPFVSAHGVELGAFLARLADGQSGVGAPATHVVGKPAQTLDDWSFTVAELLDVTGQLTHRALTRAGGPGAIRGRSHSIRMAGQPKQPPVTNSTSRIAFSKSASSGPPDDFGGAERPWSSGISYIHCIIERRL